MVFRLPVVSKEIADAVSETGNSRTYLRGLRKRYSYENPHLSRLVYNVEIELFSDYETRKNMDYIFLTTMRALEKQGELEEPGKKLPKVSRESIKSVLADLDKEKDLLSGLAERYVHGNRSLTHSFRYSGLRLPEDKREFAARLYVIILRMLEAQGESDEMAAGFEVV